MSMSKLTAASRRNYTDEDTTSQPGKMMEDLPPEVMTEILEYATLNAKRKTIFGYRLVNSQWMDIVDSLLEKEVVSRRLQIFPAVKIGGGQSDQLYVHSPTTVFTPGRNPLTFNSLLLNGSKRFTGIADTVMTLPIFMSKFGSNLTSFALHDQIIGTKSLAAILGSMSNLKVLRFEDVELTSSIVSSGSLQPPPLANLTTLEFKSQYKHGERGEGRIILYIWLVASYADQLVRLTLEVRDPFPALQKGHQYSYTSRTGEKFCIATTSDAAFGNLKELDVLCPTPQFLQFTEAPKLLCLSITGFQLPIRVADVGALISKTGRTLRKIYLDNVWDDNANYSDAGRLLATAGNVKTMTLRCSADNFEDALLGKHLLRMFPALELLQFLRLESVEFDYWTTTYHRQINAGLLVNERGRDEIISLKQRLELLWGQKAALRTMSGAHVLERRIFALKQLGKERTSLFKRLANLGENAKKIHIEQMLERQGVWSSCPNLKTVSVGMGWNPDWNEFVIRRIDDVID